MNTKTNPNIRLYARKIEEDATEQERAKIPKTGRILIRALLRWKLELSSTGMTMAGTATASTSYATPNTRRLPDDAVAVELEVEADDRIYYYSFEHDGKWYRVVYDD